MENQIGGHNEVHRNQVGAGGVPPEDVRPVPPGRRGLRAVPRTEKPHGIVWYTWGGIWTDITSTYAGLYFRAEETVGGTDNSSGAFNAGGVTVQGEGLPNIVGQINNVQTGSNDTYNGAFELTRVTDTQAATYGGGRYNCVVNFNAWRSNPVYGSSAHVTPVNTAIRIWKRTS